MTELSGLHSQARRLILKLNQSLEKCESIEETKCTSQIERLDLDFTQLKKLSVEMESIWRMHVIRENTSKRDLWKRKVEQITEDVESLSKSITVLKRRSQRLQQEAMEREELFSRRAAGAAMAAQMDEESQLASSVHRSKSMLEEALETGSSILESMTGNREILKQTQRRLLDVLNTVGLSESLLKLIDRRQRGDARLTYFGMICIVLLLIVLCWFYL